MRSYPSPYDLKSPFRQRRGGISWLSSTRAAIGEDPACAYHFDTGNYATADTDGGPLIQRTQAVAVDPFYTGDGIVFAAGGVEIYAAGQNGRTLNDIIDINDGGTDPWLGFDDTPIYCFMVEWPNDGGAGSSRPVANVTNGAFNRAIVEQMSATTARVLAVGSAPASQTISASPASNRIAVFVNETAVRFSVNESSIVTFSSGATGAADRLSIGRGPTSGIYLNGIVAKVEGVNGSLTDAQLQAWSALPISYEPIAAASIIASATIIYEGGLAA